MRIYKRLSPFVLALCALCAPGASKTCAQELWPELSTPASAIGGGDNDAAVVVGVEGYAFVSPVPGAESNAKLWHQYLTETRGLAPQNVKLLTGVDATREEILEAAQWDRYAKELAATEEARQKRAETRDKDWEKLGRLLAMKVVPAQDKTRWATMFVSAYGKTSEDNPYLAELSGYLPVGTVKVTLKARAVAPRVARGIEWVTIQGGSFTMGSGNEEEGPQHQVTVRAFQMAKTLVTNKQFQACVDAGVCKAALSYGEKFSGDNQPVVGVDWNDAKTFSEWVGGRLPSEAEWEYAARSAGKDYKYPWGNEDATCERAVIFGCSNGAALPVCSKPAGNTAQGLCDMAGNVRQWVQDWYHGSYNRAPTDGSAWESPTSPSRVLRGGSWEDGAGDARSASRHYYVPGFRFNNYGFRPAR